MKTILRECTDKISMVPCVDGLYTSCYGLVYVIFKLLKAGLLPEHEQLEPFLLAVKSKTNFNENDKISAFFGIPCSLYVQGLFYRIENRPFHASNVRKQIWQLFRDVGLSFSKPLKFEYEVLYGIAGLLQMSLLITSDLDENIVPMVFKKHLCEFLFIKGIQDTNNVLQPLKYEFYRTEYLGMAHGVSGIILALLNHHYLLKYSQKALLEITIDHCLTLENKPGEFPTVVTKHASGESNLFHWCHGGPGMIHMFATAYEVYQKKEYLEVCERIAEAVWEKGLLRKGPGLCHGICGNAYTFLRLRNIIRDEEQKRINLMRAFCFADFTLNNQQFKTEALMKPDNPYSLFEGMAAIPVLLCDLRNPDDAKFPLCP